MLMSPNVRHSLIRMIGTITECGEGGRILFRDENSQVWILNAEPPAYERCVELRDQRVVIQVVRDGGEVKLVNGWPVESPPPKEDIAERSRGIISEWEETLTKLKD